MHPAVAAVLRQAHELQSIMDAQLQKMNTDTFTGSDASRTVEVTLDGHHQLTDVYIAEGTMRLGVHTVQARLNEALQNATAAATAAIEADRERIDAMVAELTGRES
ncbi:YbaB/EbfC family nucleoid-associated protein [Mycolicibacterium sp. S2-37]|nr:YbaB/EbfC family nucleoid-associated protein [Mycolicibacterium sp. S2-37]